MAPASPLALFGGTFDPVHKAHIEGALAVSRALGDCEVRMLPNSVPPHRPQPRASAEHRLAMLDLACAAYPQLLVDDLELRRPAPSYSVDTLRFWRERLGQAPLAWVIGADSLAQLHQWRHWEDFATLGHLVVIPRPDSRPPVQAVVGAFPETDSDGLRATPAGKRLMLPAPLLDLSATDIREALRHGNTPPELDPEVMRYIRRHELYGTGTCV